MEIPKCCPIVHGDGASLRAIREQRKADRVLWRTMFNNGIAGPQLQQAEIEAEKLDRCSNRAKPGEHNPAALRRHKQQPYPPNMFAHVKSVKAYQSRDRRDMTPNVQYVNVNFGCGGPFSAECLTGWTEIGLLTHRLHLWGDAITHPRPCNNECLAGWSGADLDAYRLETWAVYENKFATDTYPQSWRGVKDHEYRATAFRHLYHQTTPCAHRTDWVVLNYKNLSHRHSDQPRWDAESGRWVPDPVPGEVSVPLPERLDQVLRTMRRARQPNSPLPTEEQDEGSIGDLLGHLEEAFDEQEPLTGGSAQAQIGGSAEEESAAKETENSEPRAQVAGEGGLERVVTAVDEPGAGSSAREQRDLTRVETPEEGEARRQRARKEIREKIARDFPCTQRKEEGVVISGSGEEEG